MLVSRERGARVLVSEVRVKVSEGRENVLVSAPGRETELETVRESGLRKGVVRGRVEPNDGPEDCGVLVAANGRGLGVRDFGVEENGSAGKRMIGAGPKVAG